MSNINNMVGQALHSIGKHKNANPAKFDQQELHRGVEIEREHTRHPIIAKEIAKDHLSEIPDYYSRLDKMEKEAKKNDTKN